jgi:glucosamine-6-phosphate deaminase
MDRTGYNEDIKLPKFNLMVSSTLVRSLTVDGLKVEIYPDRQELIATLVDRLQTHLQTAINDRGRATAILASGSSQIQLLDRLTATTAIDWSKMTLFHLDEYLGIDGNHPASFQRYMKELVADKVNPHCFNYLRGDTLEPMAECDRYRRLLADRSIDLCLLGVGETGHIAFNDPEVANFDDPYAVKIVKLAEKSRQQQVNAGFFDLINDVPQYALTLTIPSIIQALKISCIALGENKAAVVNRILTGKISTDCPATILRRHDRATLYLDAAAASQIDL